MEMNVLEVLSTINKSGQLLRDHRLLLDPVYIHGESGTVNITEEMQAYLIKEIKETACKIKGACDYIAGTNDGGLAQKVVAMQSDIRLLVRNGKPLFTDINRAAYFSGLAALDCNIRLVIEHFNLKGICLTKANTAGNDNLPDGLNTDKAKKYFARAIEAGYMTRDKNGYKWEYGGNKGQIRLGYFCYKVFDQPRPINCLEALFGVKKLSSSITNASYKPNTAGANRWRKEIDNKIFYD